MTNEEQQKLAARIGAAVTRMVHGSLPMVLEGATLEVSAEIRPDPQQPRVRIRCAVSEREGTARRKRE